MTHLSDDELVLLHYGEETGPHATAHLEACPECGERLRRLRETLALAGAPETPEPDDSFEARVWARLQPRLAARQARATRLSWRRAWPRAAGAAALAASLLVAFLLGREFPSRPRPLPPEVRERVLLVAVDEHLERTRMVLAELAYAPVGERLDVSPQRTAAHELVEANRLYRQAAARSGEGGLVALLEELERVLVEVAAGPDALGPRDLAELQERIEARGLLFKCRVLQSHVRERERKALPGRGAST
jgi:hypothetical protein